MYNAEVPFDPLLRASDSVGQAVIHVWAGSFFLSMGLPLAGPGDRAFHQAPAGRLLVLRHLLSRTARSSSVHPRGSATRLGASSRVLSGIWAEVTQISTTPETLYNYASFLKTANRRKESREWAQKLLAKKRTLPRYMQRRERLWFRKGNALLKELASV